MYPVGTPEFSAHVRNPALYKLAQEVQDFNEGQEGSDAENVMDDAGLVDLVNTAAPALEYGSGPPFRLHNARPQRSLLSFLYMHADRLVADGFRDSVGNAARQVLGAKGIGKTTVLRAMCKFLPVVHRASSLHTLYRLRRGAQAPPSR